jgi:hypothetical protein
MRKLEFIGTVRAKNTGFTHEMQIPGRDALYLRPDDWPERLAPGTLNIEIREFPKTFDEIGTDDGLKKLDEGKFKAALAIPQRLIGGNTVESTRDQPTKGFAQVWQADLHVIATGQEATCWMLRIIGSEDTAEIELVDHEDLRSRLRLADGAAIKVTAWEDERNKKLPSPSEQITDWCEAARDIEDDYGHEKAIGYLIGEKFLNFLEVAETDRQWDEAIPTFVGEIKSVFENWQIAQYLNTPHRLGALGHVADEETHRMFRAQLEEEERNREDARNLMLLEWAKELLLDDTEP